MQWRDLLRAEREPFMSDEWGLIPVGVPALEFAFLMISAMNIGIISLARK